MFREIKKYTHTNCDGDILSSQFKNIILLFLVFTIALGIYVHFEETKITSLESQSDSKGTHKIATYTVNSNIIQLNSDKFCIDQFKTNITPILFQEKIFVPLNSIADFTESELSVDKVNKLFVLTKDDLKIIFKIDSNEIQILYDNRVTTKNMLMGTIMQNECLLIDPYELRDYLMIDVKQCNNKVIIARNYASKTIVLKFDQPLDISEYKINKNTYDPETHTVTWTFLTELDTKLCFESLKDNKNINFIKVAGSIDHTQNCISWASERVKSHEYMKFITENFDISDSDIIVAIVDSGIDENHPDLAGRVTNTRYNFVNNNINTIDNFGHGTMIAGIIADNTPVNVQLMPVKVTQHNGKGNSNNVARGITFAVDNGADIINLSLSIDNGHSKAVESAIEYAIKNRVVVIIAAGNSNTNTNYVCPMHMKDVIVVGGVDQKDKRVSFSNFGSTVTVAAPGSKILSTHLNNSYKISDGTSLAAPYVSAQVAMIYSVNRDLGIPEVIDIVKRSAQPFNSDQPLGCGIINMDNMKIFGDFKKYVCPARAS